MLRFRLYCAVLFGIFIILLSDLSVAQNMHYDGPIDGAGDPAALREGLMDGNRVILQFQNTTELGMHPAVPHYSSWWPKDNGGQTMHHGVALIVSTRVYINKEDDLPVDQPAEIDHLGEINLLDTLYFCQTHFRIGMDQNSAGTIRWGFYPVWGYFNPASDSPAMSTKPESWPTDGWPATGLEKKWPGEWNGRFGRGIQYADLESFIVANDAQDQEYLQEDAPVKYYPRPGVNIGDVNSNVSIQKGRPWGGLGLRIEMRLYQWNNVETRDCIFMEYTIANCSDYNYPATGMGLLIDPVIGDNEEAFYELGYFNQALDLVYSWDANFRGQYGIVPGIMGFAFLETPGNPDDGTDNDEDGLVDERRDNPAMRLVGPEEGISDRQKFYERFGIYYTNLREHWDADEDQDWDDGLDLNNNGRYERGEYAGDDVGLDGLGPDDINYLGPDAGECDHRPSFETGVGCEPDFNLTDVSESDMLGLTTYQGYQLPPTPYNEALLFFNDDRGMFQMISSNIFDEWLRQPTDLLQLLTTYPFAFISGHIERFSAAELHTFENLAGLESPDHEAPVLFQLKETSQIIYEQDYRFARPPLAPVLTATAGDGYVLLTWDDRAEHYTREPLLGNVNDFEGYKLYRATDATFKSAEVVIEPLQARIKNPILQCDLKDGKKGMSPYSNSQDEVFYLGDDSGITHYFRDDGVQYGRTYYYALVAYDYGIPPEDLKGVSGAENGVSPQENSAQIVMNEKGEIEFLPVNCAVVVPGPKAAGSIVVDDEIELTYNRMSGSGDLVITVAEPDLLKTGSSYYLKFYNNELRDMRFYDTAFDYVAEGLEIWRVEPAADVLVYQDKPVYVDKTNTISDYVVQNKNSILKAEYMEGDDYPLYYLPDDQPGITGIFDGLQLSVRCIKQAVLDQQKSGWLNNKNFHINIRTSEFFKFYPFDYHLVFTDQLREIDTKIPTLSTIRNEVGEVITTDKLLKPPVNFYVENLQVKDPDTGEPARMEILIHDMNSSGHYEPAYDRVLVGAPNTLTWRWNTTLFAFDFIGIKESDLPESGATYLFTFQRPFTDSDSISFTVRAREAIDGKITAYDMNKIRVVPNPYLFANAMESHPAGGRRLMFTHLPQKCTIKIFTVSGYLVREIRVPEESLIPFGDYTDSSDGIVHWDLRNLDGREVAPGMYFYCVRDLMTGKEKLGKFAVIK